MRERFPNYKSFAETPMQNLFTKEQMKDALVLKANHLQSSFIRNNGNGKFSLEPLPMQAQFSALNGMTVDDFDGDGNADIAIVGNDYGTEVSVGRYDALNGLILKGNGKGAFQALSIAKAGLFVPGNARGLVKLLGKDNSYQLAASSNGGPLQLFGASNNSRNYIRLGTNDISATITMNNGTLQKQEFYYGVSFLSQSSRFMVVPTGAKTIEIMNSIGEKRKEQVAAQN